MADKPTNKQGAATASAKPTSTPAPATPAATPAPATAPVANLKKGPSPVFSIPATNADKTFISLQASRTGKSQKELLHMAVESARKAIEALPKYVEPVVEVKSKAKKAEQAAQALAATPATTAS